MNEPKDIDSTAVDQIHSASIQIANLEKGVIVFVETENAIYEFTVRIPDQCVVAINTNDNRFEEGQLVCINTPILWGDCIRMIVGETAQFSKRVNGATVKGEGWNYDVF